MEAPNKISVSSNGDKVSLSLESKTPVICNNEPTMPMIDASNLIFFSPYLVISFGIQIAHGEDSKKIKPRGTVDIELYPFSTSTFCAGRCIVIRFMMMMKERRR